MGKKKKEKIDLTDFSRLTDKQKAFIRERVVELYEKAGQLAVLHFYSKTDLVGSFAKYVLNRISSVTRII